MLAARIRIIKHDYPQQNTGIAQSIPQTIGNSCKSQYNLRITLHCVGDYYWKVKGGKHCAVPSN